jgi:hypothetical protein
MTANCHCRDCQYASGGGFSTVVLVPAPALQVKGEPSEYTVDTDSGSTVTRQFCGTCGTPVVSVLNGMPAMLVVKGGTLDDPSWLQIASNMWTDSAQPWAHIDAELPRHAKNPG